MLRRLVFALMLIGAAFAGGAAINGPGLAWLQRNFAGGPSIIVDSGPAQAPSATKAPPRQFPTARNPPLLVDLPRAPGASDPRKAGKAEAAVDLARADLPLLPDSPSTPASALAPLPRPIGPEADPASPAFASIDPRSSPPPLDPGPTPKADPVARLASVESPALAAPHPSAPSKDWAELRGRMKALGVVRYTIEGEPDGRVRFSCVIPVDGLKAVGHHFEAEGDDEPQAVEATLKRITLWKATSSSQD